MFYIFLVVNLYIFIISILEMDYLRLRRNWQFYFLVDFLS